MKVRWFIFWFEANQSWGLVKSKSDWERIVRNHISGWNEEDCMTMSEMAVKLMGMAHATKDTVHLVQTGKPKPYGSKCPNFGLYTHMEHSEPLTLAEWARKNGMYDRLTLTEDKG